MASINRYQTINDIPASKGKDVLLKILNSPKADFVRARRFQPHLSSAEIAKS